MWPNQQFLVGLFTFTEEILNGNIHFLCNVPYTYTPFSNTVGLLLHLQCYQKCEPMISKKWLKCKFVLWQSRYYKLLTKKRDKKIHVFWSIHFFENVLLHSIPRNYLQIASFDYKLLGNFTWSKSIILVKNLIRWKRDFEIFLIDHHAGDIGNKNITGKYLRILVSVSFVWFQFLYHFTYRDISIIPWFI